MQFSSRGSATVGGSGECNDNYCTSALWRFQQVFLELFQQKVNEAI